MGWCDRDIAGETDRPWDKAKVGGDIGREAPSQYTERRRDRQAGRRGRRAGGEAGRRGDGERGDEPFGDLTGEPADFGTSIALRRCTARADGTGSELYC